MATSTAKEAEKQSSNMGVDYVIVYGFGSSDKKEAVAQFEELIKALVSVGLETEVRPGENNTLLVFVKEASKDHLNSEVYRSRVKDWIHGVRTEAPGTDISAALESDPLSEAERLRIVYQLITHSPDEGGAGIHPKQGKWSNVQAIFGLQDPQFNTQWVKGMSKQYFISADHLDMIRDQFGEKVAYYFAFTQTYFTFLLFNAAAGLSAWLLLGHFSSFYAIVNALWCIIFTEYWKHQEVDLALRWGVRGVSGIEAQRRQFIYIKEIEDTVTGEKVKYFPASTRLYRQLLQIPFAIAVALALGCLIATVFGIEIFISEVYNGPLKSVLIYLPTGITTIAMPILTGLLQNMAKRLTDYENYETEGAYKTAITQKLFIMDIFTSYLGIFLTAFVYVPFGKIIVPYLDVFSLAVKPFAEHQKQVEIDPQKFSINPDRLRKQVIYFTVTAQVVNALMELVVPYVTRQGTAKIKELQTDYAMKHGGGAVPSPSENDAPEEAEFLARVRKEAALPEYDVDVDTREMVIQFGYLSLFSVVWPFTPVSFLINNWVELRADALKISVEMQRPFPHRADTIGPWLDSLSFLTWLGSITSSALVYMFSNDGVGEDGTPYAIKLWALLLTVFLSEQSFLAVRWAVQKAVRKFGSPAMAQDRRRKYLIRKRYVDESFKMVSGKASPAAAAAKGFGLDASTTFEKIDKASLEDHARDAASSSPEERFWMRQKGWKETSNVGQSLISRMTADKQETKKDK